MKRIEILLDIEYLRSGSVKIVKIESENQLYDAILERLSVIASKRKDDARWESQTYVELMRILKNGEEPSNNAVSNSILLLLALFNPGREGVDLWGTDMQKINPKDRQQLIYELLDALPTPISQ